jgi:uncharacterized protein DUF6498
MFKYKPKQADLFVIIANLIPVYGVIFLGWSPVEAFIVYALETLIAGAFTVLKLLVVTIYRKKDTWYNAGSSQQVSGLFFIFFFIMHFGLFAAVQSSIFSQAARISPPGSGLLHFFFHWYDYINNDIGFMLCAFVISYFARSFIPFIISGEYKTVSMMALMFQPYGRIFIQQFTVIAGSMFLAMGAGKGFVIVFVLAKLYFDVVVNMDGIINKSVAEMQNQQLKK